MSVTLALSASSVCLSVCRPPSIPSISSLPSLHSHCAEKPRPTAATATTITLQSWLFHTVRPSRLQPPVSDHIPAPSSPLIPHCPPPPSPVLLPSSTALLKDKAAVGGASRECLVERVAEQGGKDSLCMTGLPPASVSEEKPDIVPPRG